MIKCRRKQATDPQKLKNCKQSFSRFLLVDAKAIDELAASTTLPETHKSQRQIAAQLQVSRRSVQRMTKDLGFKAFKRIRVSRRDANVRTKRKTRRRNLYG